MTTVDPDDIAGAQEALHHVGLGEIDPRILAAVLEADPSIAGTAKSWGWTDTEVRDDVAEMVSRFLLGIAGEEYIARLRRGERELTADVRAAHDRWVAANPTAS
ncbi:hypothetical protein [Micromonospora sp. CA-248212]|uniref:hypothetical protein n=1 Tax=Micromonospora sp. CA-248212 TaxID=3239961 RepID=UPI003D8F15C0